MMTLITRLPKNKPRNGHRLIGFFIVGAVLAAVAIALLLSGCAGVAGYEQSLSNIERTETAVAKSFETFDAAYQKQIVDKAVASGQPETAHEALQAYRTKRAVVVGLVLEGQALVAAANALVPLLKSGAKKPADIEALLASLVALGMKLQQAFVDLGAVGTGTMSAVPSPTTGVK